jgi:HAD superfamily hydrolase (TIGR01509 family)
MAARQPAYVLFDLGNVLVHIHPGAFLQMLGISTPEDKTYYQPRIIDIARKYERGDESTEQFMARLDLLFNSPDNGRRRDRDAKKILTSSDFRRAMLAVIGQPIVGMDELVQRVAATVPLGLLSNTNPIHFDFCLETLRVLQLIPSHFLSYELKSFKPESKIFERVREILKLNPGDVLYVDDLPENVEAASAIGFAGYLFEGPKQLEQHLSTLQLI